MDEIKETGNIKLYFSLDFPDTYFGPGKYPTLMNKWKTRINKDQLIKYSTLSELESRIDVKKQIVRYVEIGEIVDYWRAARISLTYKILLPKGISDFEERQYNSLLGYKKNSMNYSLMKDHVQNGCELIKQ